MEKSDLEKKFFALYENESDAIFRFVLFKIGERERALDITQEAFVRTWEYLSKGKLIENKRAFLYRVAGNMVIDQYRKRKEFSLDALKESGFDASDERHAPIDLKMDMKEAVSVLNTLPEKYRDAVYLRVVEGWSVKDMAVHFGASESNMSVRIHRGMKLLREKLQQKGKRL